MPPICVVPVIEKLRPDFILFLFSILPGAVSANEYFVAVTLKIVRKKGNSVTKKPLYIEL